MLVILEGATLMVDVQYSKLRRVVKTSWPVIQIQTEVIEPSALNFDILRPMQIRSRYRLYFGTFVLVLSFVLALSDVLVRAALAAEPVGPPATRVAVVTDRMHGVEIADPYRWLEDQESPETRAWITAQNAYTRSVLDPFAGRERLRAQLEKMTRIDAQGAPTLCNGRYFFTRRGANQEQDAILVRQGIDGAERVLVDPAKLSQDSSVSASLLNVTPDGRTLAWGKRKGGADEMEVYFLDVDSGQDKVDHLSRGTYYRVFVLPDGSGFLYSRRGTEGTRLLEHRFGKSFGEDRELFGAGIPDEKLMWFQISEDGRFVVASVNDGAGNNARSRLYYLDRSREGGFQPLITDVAANFSGYFGGHSLFLHTNWNAVNRRVLRIDLENPQRDQWREVVPTSKDSVITSVWPESKTLLVSFLQNVSTRLAIFDLEGKPIRDVSLPAPGVGFFTGTAGWNATEFYYSFQSFAQPRTTYRYDLRTGKQSVWFQPKIAVNTEAIQTNQVWFTSKDGTRVPMFLVAKKGTKLDGKRPVLLNGYGGYGAISLPYFNPEVAMWVDRGGVFAYANIRGGGEFGDQWHRGGMLENKQNSFDDFVAAAEWLIAHKYTRPSQLAIEGGSNGGMLVGAVAVQRPDLFRAVVSHNPHLDMLRFHKFLKAAPWVKEYGNPEVAEEFAYLRKYSPYQNVRDGAKYPAMLFTTGDGDTRVAPLHARKMAARMQAATRSGWPVLLRYDLVAGHSGSVGSVSQRLDIRTDVLVFLYSQLGVMP